MKSLYKKIISLCLLLLFIAPVAQASSNYSAYFSKAEIDDGVYLGSLDDQFHVSFPAKTYSSSINVYIEEATSPANMPVGNLKSKVYLYHVLSQTEPKNEFELAVRFDSDSIQAKNIWHYDYDTNTWQQLPTRVDWPGRLAIAKTSLSHGKIVLVEDKAVEYEQIENSTIADWQNNFRINLADNRSFDRINIENYNIDLYPQSYQRVSDIYQYDLHSDSYLKEEITLEFSYIIEKWKMPTIFYWDKMASQWVELETGADLDNNIIFANTKMPYARIALFMKPDIWAGEASWYKYKDCNCAASRDYAKGTNLKVTHLSTGKSANVVVNDYGPELWTDRIIDLDATVFSQFGSLRWGVTDVKIELIP